MATSATDSSQHDKKANTSDEEYSLTHTAQFKRPQNRTLAILCCFVALLCILVLGSVSVIEWSFRLPFDIDAPTTVAGLNYGSHATMERQVFTAKR